MTRTKCYQHWGPQPFLFLLFFFSPRKTLPKCGSYKSFCLTGLQLKYFYDQIMPYVIKWNVHSKISVPCTMKNLPLRVKWKNQGQMRNSHTSLPGIYRYLSKSLFSFGLFLRRSKMSREGKDFSRDWIVFEGLLILQYVNSLFSHHHFSVLQPTLNRAKITICKKYFLSLHVISWTVSPTPNSYAEVLSPSTSKCDPICVAAKCSTNRVSVIVQLW